MPFFRKHKSPQSSFSAIVDPSHAHSAEQLSGSSSSPAFPPADNNNHDYDRRYSEQPLSNYEEHHPNSSPPVQHHVQRSQSQRQSQLLDRPTVNLVVPTSPASAPRFDADPLEQPWPSPSTNGPPQSTTGRDLQSRKSKRNIFHLHSSSKDRDDTSFLERNRSVKKSSRRPQPSLEVETASRHNHRGSAAASPNSLVGIAEHVVDSDRSSLNLVSQMPQTSRTSLTGHSPREPRPFARSPRSDHDFPSIQRSNTDPTLLDRFFRQSSEVPEDVARPGSQHAAYSSHDRSYEQSVESHIPSEQVYLHRQYPQLDPALAARPGSQQSLGPPSPGPSPYNHPEFQQRGPPYADSVQPPISHMAGSERPPGMRTQAPEPGSQLAPTRDAQPGGHSPYTQGPPQEASFKGNASQPSIQEGGRNTPTPTQGKGRDDVGDVDVRALLQKHEELQAKYSKVKRYYFEKDAQVQHLQNTVAHQRMAVSRTVLDDNEYTSRFNRLDGAIKDLAFSIRKDWKCIPTWLQPYVNADAHAVGMKEMTAVGRAVISHWLVEEVFQRHFHPALEPNFSMQLKNIEMNLRRQQINTSTEEDKENAIARISNWRRTTFDGLTGVLQGKMADDNRSQLISHLVDKLVASLEMNLVDPPPPGVATGARMIVENSVGISEKIPLESRDICVEYFMPGTPVAENYMKIETGLPPLANASLLMHARASVDQERSPHPRGDGTHDEADADREPDSSSPSTTNSGMEGSTHLPASPPPAKEPKKKSVFSSLMGKKPAAAAGNVAPPVESARPPSTVLKEAKDEMEKGEASTARIRLASFLTVDVRGKGPTNVLVKAPVYLVE